MARPERPSRARRARSTAFRLTGVVIAGGLALSACGGGGDNGKEAADTSGETPKSGGSVNIVMASDIRSLDPFQALTNSYTDVTRLNALYDSLFWTEAGTGRIMPQIGESITADPTNTVWTIKLKPNVKFTDGTPYDAAAVKFNFDQHANPERKSTQAAVVRSVKESTVVDPTTLQITLNAPNGSFDHTVASNLPFIVSPTAYQKDPAGFAKAPVGAGPFTLKEWQPNDHLTLAKNPNYWQGPDKPYLDTLNFKIIADSDQGLETVANGGADLKVSVNAEDPVKAKQKGLEVDTVTQIGGESIFFNSAKPPFDDPRARRAVSLALDAEGVNQVSFHNNGTPTRSIFPKGSPLVDEGSTTVAAPNQAEAQRLLDELAAEGKPLSFTYLLPQNANANRTGEYIQSRLRTLKNIDVKLESVTIVAYQTQVVVQRNYDAALWSFYAADAEPGLYANFHSTSPGNYLGYKNPAADALIDRARSASTEAERKAAWTEFTKVIQEDAPLWTYQSSVITAYQRPTVVGLVLTQDGMVLTDRFGQKA